MLLEAVMIGGALTSAFGKWQSGKEAQRVAERAAREFDRAAAETLQQGEGGAFLSRMKGRDIVSSARVAFAGSGTDAEESALHQNALASEMEAESIRENARREAWGLKRRATNVRLQGADAAKAAKRDAVTSLIGSAASIGAKMYTPGPGPAPSGQAFWGE